MPLYDYMCRNEECESVKSGEPDWVERMCGIEASKKLPKCMFCGHEMPKAYLGMPDVVWVGIDLNGKRKKFNKGPSERANRRHAGWDNGVKVLQPVYRGKGSVVKNGQEGIRRQGRSEGDAGGAEGGHPGSSGPEASGS